MELTTTNNPLDHFTRIEYKGQPVLTTEQLAACLSTEDKVVKPQNLIYNFNYNRDRYIKEKHFFVLEGSELELLRIGNSNLQISPKARVIYLWTKRGCLHHCKSINTDVAWKVYEKLEDTYFNVVGEHDAPLPSIADYERGLALCRLSSHAKDPYTKKRLVAEAANLISGKALLKPPTAQMTLFK